MKYACYLCAHDGFRRRKGAVRDAPNLQILECVNCGLVTLSSHDHIGPGHYESSGMYGSDKSPPVEFMLRSTEQDDQRRFDMLKPILVNRRVLDFGCGAAGFLRKAQSLATEVVGIEPERRLRDFFGNSACLYPDIKSAGVGYDLITAFHVVEHLPDPRAILKTLSGLLTDGGRLIVEVPSSDDALLSLYDCDAFQRFTYWSQHLYLFNPETFRRLAVQADLRVISIQQFQRYPLSNHLHWLSKGRPGGHQEWLFLDSQALNQAYAAALAAVGKCDTLICHLEADNYQLR